MIYLHASRDHYARHLWPIWTALPDAVRGTAWSTRSSWWGEPVRRRPEGLTLVASATDATRCPGRYVYVEHGAGQSYVVSNPSYSGGAGHDRCVLFLCPNEMVAARWRAAYPDAPAVVIGGPTVGATTGEPPPAGPVHTHTRPAVAFTFHWNCALVPETRSALEHYQRRLPAIVAELTAAGVEVLGHGHPRAWPQLADLWRRLGVAPVPRWSTVEQRASVLVADNTSALYEFAALDRPVVVLNAPWYRRHVEHGLRFWSHVPGAQIDDPDDVTQAVLDALAGDTWADVRRRVVTDVYPHRGTDAARRAVAAIMEVL